MNLHPKYSLGSWAFSFGPFAKNPWSFKQFCEYASSAGYNGVEINGFRPHPHFDDYGSSDRVHELSKYISSLGLGISAYAPDFSDVPPAEIDKKIYLETIGKCLNFCNSLDIEILRVDTVSPPLEYEVLDYEKKFKCLCDTWRDAAKMAKSAGVKIVWEFEPGFWLNKPKEVIRLLNEIDHSNFKALFDTSHAYMCSVVGARQVGKRETLQNGVIEYANLLQGNIGHVHFIDSDGTLHNNETSTHAPFGSGNIDFKELISSMKSDLKELKWWCFDFCFCPTTERDAKTAIAYMNNVLQSVNEC